MGLGWVSTGQTSSEENPVLQQAVIPQYAARGHHTRRLSELLGATHTPSFMLTFTLTGVWSLSLIPNVHFQGSPKHCYLPALPVRPVFVQDCHHQLSLCSSPLHEPSCCFTAPGAHTWGAQHCKAGIPTGAELKNYCIPCSLLLGKMCVKGDAFLVH